MFVQKVRPFVPPSATRLATVEPSSMCQTADCQRSEYFYPHSLSHCRTLVHVSDCRLSEVRILLPTLT